MQYKLSLSVTRLKWAPYPHTRGRFRPGYPTRDLSHHISRFKLVGQSSSDKWKLNEIDANAVQEQVNSWLSKTQNFLSEVTLPLVKAGRGRKPDVENASTTQEELEIFMAELTVNRKTPKGILSLETVVSIEQFGRMNGLTGQKMQRIFSALVPETVYADARNLVEYCCFRYLSRDSSRIHPSLKEPAFQKLIFITMLAWESPYCREESAYAYSSDKALFQDKTVGQEAFTRIAPAISGVADYCTVHSLFKALAGEESGISLRSWLTYINELLKVHEGRKTYQPPETFHLSEEKILCVGSSRKHPVLKWDNNIAWPGKVILTDKAIYFEAVGRKESSRLDLTRKGLQVEKAKVGPLGSFLFDSAVSISCGPQSETWMLEFVDLGGEMRRDVWHAFISEIISLHKFIHEYAPKEGEKTVSYVFGAHRGKERATISAANSIARLQVLQFMRKLLDDPTKFVQFSYLMNAPYGDIVSQALAVNFWGGPLVTKFSEAGTEQAPSASVEVSERVSPVFDIDGSIYLKKWMRSPSWFSSASINFWKNSTVTKQGLALSKNLVVGDAGLVEKAALTCRRKSQAVEKTQATIDAAMLKGIPNNIDLFKEIMLPLTVVAKTFEKLRHWEEPYLTISFLAFSYTIIFRDLLSYVFPATLIALAAAMLTLKGLKEQGRLGRFFGKVIIRDQPPSNTIQKILAVKDAMRDVESYLQNLNVILLKIRTIVLSGQPQITMEVALVLLSSATIMLIVPFKYILSFLLLDLFTRELEFRREMVQRFMSFLKERWKMVPAAPVVVLPYENDESKSPTEGMQNDKNDEVNMGKSQISSKSR